MIIITGQTATGKTNLALKYAKKYHGEIINFDSRQIYKHLDIITGKDKSEIKNKKLKIHLYDIVTPDKYFSSFEYVKLAKKVIKDITFRGKNPILVGGSYFYLKHLIYGFDFAVAPNFKLRKELNKKSVAELQRILLKTVPLGNIPEINQSDWNNPRRLIRKIEILQQQKLSVSVSKITNLIPPKNLKIFIGLRYKNKEKLRKAIEKRVEKRLKQGAIEEVKKLLKMGYKKTDPGLKTIGYRQIIEYLEKKVSQKKAIENWINAEVKYAKKQYTFMKKDTNINWQSI